MSNKKNFNKKNTLKQESNKTDSQKQIVQWFPGHMAKTRRLIKESIPFVDLVTEIVDARIPLSSSNPELSEMIGNKPRIVLLNKCDVADEKATKQWVEYYKTKGIYALPVDCRSGKALNAYLPLVREILKDKIQKNSEKGMVGKPLRVMVVGIPNTGKSSFINKMAGRNRAKVADKPGVTRSNSWFAVGNGIELLDTPGVLWPKFDDPKVGDKLAFIGSVKDEVLDSETLALKLINVLKTDYAERLTERFKITDFDEMQDYEILELIGRKRGMLISGGEIDTERASIILLDEYRGGKLGKLTLEYPREYE
ncbi:MAG: ribosome biogenesis GTPase YlqF [Clostridia bacterium]|nr:ribosome biogenesis GTPase YlqF [Clostridia bacterium]